MAGPRLTAGAFGTKVFAHALFGGEHSANGGGPTPISAGAFSYALGGGLDVPIAPFFSWRVAGDYLEGVLGIARGRHSRPFQHRAGFPVLKDSS